MTSATNSLQQAIAALQMPGVAIGYRFISIGDEQALWPAEREAFANSVEKVRRASGAARLVARQLMARLGHAEEAIVKAKSGAPIWPRGLTGSLAHDSDVAVAAIAKIGDFASLGIDVEPSEPLDDNLLKIVATTSELERIADDPFQGRLLFAIKEAIYKAVYPLDQTFLDHHDVEVNIRECTARTSGGRTVQFRYAVSSHLVVLAFI